MNTVEELINELKKHPLDKKVFIQFQEPINLNLIEVKIIKVPESVSFEDGTSEILVIKPKV